MQKLIVHIEYDAAVETVGGAIEDAVERTLDGIREQAGGDDADFGYRFFGSLEDAEAWESGAKGIEEVGV